MKKSEVEFVEALRKVGFSSSICENINKIRKVVFESGEGFSEDQEFKKKVEEYNETHDRSLFDRVSHFLEGYARVELNGKWNFIDKEGNLLWKGEEWFDYVYRFRKGYAQVWLKGKCNYIDEDGNLLWKGYYWFDRIGSIDEFDEGCVRVMQDGSWSFINKKGNLLSPDQWFYYAHRFSDGYAAVLRRGDEKWNFIDKEGNLLSKQWFDDARDFKEGYAKVKLNGKWYKIDREGKLHEE